MLLELHYVYDAYAAQYNYQPNHGKPNIEIKQYEKFERITVDNQTYNTGDYIIMVGAKQSSRCDKDELRPDDKVELLGQVNYIVKHQLKHDPEHPKQ
jgi:hypothetical protein